MKTYFELEKEISESKMKIEIMSAQMVKIANELNQKLMDLIKIKNETS